MTPTPKENKAVRGFCSNCGNPLILYGGELVCNGDGCALSYKVPAEEKVPLKNFPATKENKTLADFLESENKKLDEDWPSARSYTAGHFNDWLSSHDTRLLAFVRENLEKEIEENREDRGILNWTIHDCEYDCKGTILNIIGRFLTPPTKV